MSTSLSLTHKATIVGTAALGNTRAVTGPADSAPVVRFVSVHYESPKYDTDSNARSTQKDARSSA